MKIKEILTDYCGEYSEMEISGLSFDSRHVERGQLFFCLNGNCEDGHYYAMDAILGGAAALVVERYIPVQAPQILVQSSRSAMAKAASEFYGNPSRKVKLIGITGTNGKTTTSYIVKSILEAAGETVGIIGTTAVMYCDRAYPSTLTTPDPIELNRIFFNMVSEGVTSIVMEVSAHALALKKTDGFIFDVAAFTNLSRDHLDFFKDMENYADAKRQLFTLSHAKSAVINVDDSVGFDIARKCDLKTVTYGCNNPADVFALDLKMSAEGIKYILNLADDIGEVSFALPGRFNMYNTLCAAAIAKQLNISIKDIIKGIKNVTKVEGRFNVISFKNGTVIIDYAHTDDGLRNILSTVKEFAKGKIITVFGCGGNRDKTKRPIMGEVVSNLSDVCFITSDNPRFEAAEDIILDVKNGAIKTGKNNFECVADRRDAILTALKGSINGDIVVIAGKGSEKYQEISGVRLPYNDEEFVLKIIKENNL